MPHSIHKRKNYFLRLAGFLLIAPALICLAGFFGYRALQKKISVSDVEPAIAQPRNTANSGDLKTQPNESQHQDLNIELKNFGALPNFPQKGQWLNSPSGKQPELAGKAVLIYFWTYSSINSITTLEKINKIYEMYSPQGLQIIGVHTPAYKFELNAAGVEAAIKRYKIAYPVLLDNNYEAWKNFNNQFWPTLYLSDKSGTLVNIHSGDFDSAQMSRALDLILGVASGYQTPSREVASQPVITVLQTGLAKLSGFANSERPLTEKQLYTFPKQIKINSFALEGIWRFTQESVVHEADFSTIRIFANAKTVSLIAAATNQAPVKIKINDSLEKGLVVSQHSEYVLLDNQAASENTIDVQIPASSKLEIFAIELE